TRRPDHADPPPAPTATPRCPSPEPATRTPAAPNRRYPYPATTTTAYRRIRPVSFRRRQQHAPPGARTLLLPRHRPYVRFYLSTGSMSPFSDDFSPCHRNHRLHP